MQHQKNVMAFCVIKNRYLFIYRYDYRTSTYLTSNGFLHKSLKYKKIQRQHYINNIYRSLNYQVDISLLKSKYKKNEKKSNIDDIFIFFILIGLGIITKYTITNVIKRNRINRLQT